MFILGVVMGAIKPNHFESEAILEDELIHAIAAGNQKAFEKLYQLTKSSVYGFALSILKNPQDAEDVMQDAYLQIHYNASQYRSRGKPMAWILTIVRNLCLMKIREGKKIADMPELEWERLTSPDNMDNKAELIVLKAAMNLLTDEERMIVTLHALSGCRHREIAEILQMPLATVLSKYHRALKKLKKHLEGGELQ